MIRLRCLRELQLGAPLLRLAPARLSAPPGHFPTPFVSSLPPPHTTPPPRSRQWSRRSATRWTRPLWWASTCRRLGNSCLCCCRRPTSRSCWTSTSTCCSWVRRQAFGCCFLAPACRAPAARGGARLPPGPWAAASVCSCALPAARGHVPELCPRRTCVWAGRCAWRCLPPARMPGRCLPCHSAHPAGSPLRPVPCRRHCAHAAGDPFLAANQQQACCKGQVPKRYAACEARARCAAASVAQKNLCLGMSRFALCMPPVCRPKRW